MCSSFRGLSAAFQKRTSRTVYMNLLEVAGKHNLMPFCFTYICKFGHLLQSWINNDFEKIWIQTGLTFSSRYIYNFNKFLAIKEGQLTSCNHRRSFKCTLNSVDVHLHFEIKIKFKTKYKKSHV